MNSKKLQPLIEHCKLSSGTVKMDGREHNVTYQLMLENIGIYAICYSNGVVFTNYEIVVPNTLQSNMLDLIHESHLDI